MARSSTSALCFLLLLFSSSSIQVAVALATMAVDLGSEFMKVAIVKPGVPMEIALNVESQRKTPTVVAMRNGERMFGGPALNVAVKFPKNAFLFVPLLVGKRVDSPQVVLYKQRFPYHKIVPDENGFVKFQIDDKTSYTAEELLAMLLENAWQIAIKFAEFPVKGAVITVPPFFTQSERRAVMRAARLIDLNVLQLMNDNTATALNYGIFRRKFFNATAQYYMFYDLGSSYTTATIVSYQVARSREAGMVEENPQLSIIGVGVDQSLGATAFALRMRDHLARLFTEQKKTKRDITQDRRAMAKLFKEASRVMRVLSANKDCFAQVEGLFDDKDFKAKVTRAEFEKMCADLFERVAGPVDRALEMAQIPLNVIREVLLMGGGTRVPLVQELIMKASQKTELGKSINTDEAAALGAVYQAAHLCPGFRVKRFVVKDGTYIPIKIDFERLKPGETQRKAVSRTLFNLGKAFPHKMSITFNKHVDDFTFYVGYGSLQHMSAEEAKSVGASNLTTVHLKGVTAAHGKYAAKEGVEAKGVKARFRVDESGLLALEHAEALFEKSPEAVKKESEQSTLSNKIGSTISNLFGGGSSEKTKEGDAAKEKKEEAKKEEKPEAAGEKNATQEEAPKNQTDAGKDAANATEKEKKEKEARPVLVREVLTFAVEQTDMPEPSDAAVAVSKKLIDELRERDNEKKLLERARNELESFIFESKDKLYQEDYEKCSEKAEREKLQTALAAASEWYDEQGEATLRKEYESRTQTLRDAMKEVEFRVKEMRERPRAFNLLRDILNNTEFFHRSLGNLTGEGKVFTQTEVDTLSKLINETKSWRASSEEELSKAAPAARPPVLVEDILSKSAALEREMQYLLSKAKYWVPPPTAAPANASADGKEEDKDKPQPDAKESKKEKKEEKKEGKKKEEKEKDKKATRKEPADADAKKAEKPVEDSKQKPPKTETPTDGAKATASGDAKAKSHGEL